MCADITTRETALTRARRRDAMEGFDAVVFAYGQTASGKTFTLVRHCAHWHKSTATLTLVPRTLRRQVTR